MKLSNEGLKFIQEFESCSLIAYQDIAGIWTIGWGTILIDNKPVYEGQVITQELADQLLKNEVEEKTKQLEPLLYGKKLNQNQTDALISFCYNTGINAFKGSTLRRSILADLPIKEHLFTDWCKFHNPTTHILETSNGLLRRRKDEFNLYTE